MDAQLLDWLEDYETEERTQENAMSRSNPNEGARNPSTRWFEWAGGSDGGFVRWYDKETQSQRKVDGAFTFLLLDELSTVKGWHDQSGSAIYSNEVRSTKQDALVVRSFKGGDLASGLYSDIRDRIIAYGAHYCVSLYIAFKDGDALRIGNLVLKGAAAGAWMEFKRSAPTKKDASGKSVRAYLVDAIKIGDFKQEKKGATVYRVPVFTLVGVSEETNQQAIALDVELQAFLSEYLKRIKIDQPQPAPTDSQQKPPSADDGYDAMVRHEEVDEIF